MIRRAKANGTKPVIATLTPVFDQWAWRKTSEIILNQSIRQLASEEGINCADMETAFGWNPAYIFHPDGMHPNNEGHRIIANTFYSALTR
jgi:lysophospholipase L1-like esterase